MHLLARQRQERGDTWEEQVLLCIHPCGICSPPHTHPPHTHTNTTHTLQQGPAPALQSYLNIDAIVDAAKKTGARAVRDEGSNSNSSSSSRKKKKSSAVCFPLAYCRC